MEADLNAMDQRHAEHARSLTSALTEAPGELGTESCAESAQYYASMPIYKVRITPTTATEPFKQSQNKCKLSL